MHTRHLALAAATFVAAQLGCGGSLTVTATPPTPPAVDVKVDTAAPAAPAGDDDVVVTDFTEPLGNYGIWIDDPTYGKVWQPADDVAGDDFTPYSSDGAWSASDDGSWVFEGKYDTEYGWATYHYGNWVENDDYGWVWIPGTAWAPSWVDWRYGGGNVGWAPTGPSGVVVVEDRWAFVDQVHFCDPGWRTYRLPPERIHAAFTVAVAINVNVSVGGGGGGGGGAHVGPPVASIRAAGGAVRTSHVTKPARGAVKAQAQASVQRAKTTNRPKAAAATPVKRGPAARAARAQAGGKPARGKDAAKPGARAEEHAKPGVKPVEHKPEEKKDERKPEAKHEAKPEEKKDEHKPVAKPKPEEKDKKKKKP